MVISCCQVVFLELWWRPFSCFRVVFLALLWRSVSSSTGSAPSLIPGLIRLGFIPLYTHQPGFINQALSALALYAHMLINQASSGLAPYIFLSTRRHQAQLYTFISSSTRPHQAGLINQVSSTRHQQLGLINQVFSTKLHQLGRIRLGSIPSLVIKSSPVPVSLSDRSPWQAQLVIRRYGFWLQVRHSISHTHKSSFSAKSEEIFFFKIYRKKSAWGHPPEFVFERVALPRPHNPLPCLNKPFHQV